MQKKFHKILQIRPKLANEEITVFARHNYVGGELTIDWEGVGRFSDFHLLGDCGNKIGNWFPL